MKHIIMLFILAAIFPTAVTTFAQQSEDALQVMAHKALEKLDTVEAIPFERTEHPGAMWFPEAGFGLFMHWGIHSVEGLEPSWAMMKGCPWQKDYIEYLGWTEYNNREAYYSLRDRFDPQQYDPDKWMKAAADAGMKYVVLTSKHHDGYALWPSEYGENSTKQYMDGRDLLRPYVDACRKYGLKVGFYFSPRDWGYPGYPQSMTYGAKYEFPEGWTPEQNQAAFDEFYRYTVGQISELLTRYGKIDVIWFDGMGWTNIHDIHTEKTLAWIREIQPAIIINPRWGGKGDFATPEVHLPGDAPEGWWENCVSWRGHWGYSPHAQFQSNLWVLKKLIKARSWGGNLLLNIGPGGNGEMPTEYYTRLAEIGEWMDVCGESLVGAEPVRNWDEFSNVPVTRRDGVWYLHVQPTIEENVVLENVPEPAKVVHMNTGVEFTTHRYDMEKKTLTTGIPMTVRNAINDVIEVYWDKEPVSAQ